MKYINVPFNTDLFFDIIDKIKQCYILKEKDRILHYVGYDSFNNKFVFANESDKKSYITINPFNLSAIKIFKIVPQIGDYVELNNGTITQVTESTLNLFIENDDWKLLTFNIEDQFKNVHNLDIIVLSDNNVYLYVNGFLIGENITYKKEELPKELFIKCIYGPNSKILPKGFNSLKNINKLDYVEIINYLKN